MHAFFAERTPPAEGPVAARVRQEFHRFVAERASTAERHRDVEANLLERSKLAIAQSFALLARFPDMMDSGVRWEASEQAAERRDAIAAPKPRWQDLLTDGLGDRFFFDIDDGERKRHDAVGMVLSSHDDIPREAKAVLCDLAYAQIPVGRTRVFTAKVRDARGAVVYKGTMTMRPLPND